MPASESEQASENRAQGLFVTTRWSVVLAAKDRSSPGSAQALESFCQLYWYPLYAYVRGSGYSPEDAQDLTQEFFARLLAKNFLRVVEPEKGRFRTFLRMALKRFLVHEWERLRAQKRGGGQAHLPFDTVMAEQRFQEDNAHNLSPDVSYDRRWALTLLGEAMARAQREYEACGKTEELAELKPYLTAERGEIPYEKIAGALGVSEGAARVAVHRLRKRFRELFREVIADTVSAPEEVHPELKHVIEVLSRG